MAFCIAPRIVGFIGSPFSSTYFLTKERSVSILVDPVAPAKFINIEKETSNSELGGWLDGCAKRGFDIYPHRSVDDILLKTYGNHQQLLEWSQNKVFLLSLAFET